jgi:glycosyltransferase involved in cell wall biosynthesis
MTTPERIALIAPFGLGAKGTTRARVAPLGKALAVRGKQIAVFIPPYDSPEDSGRQWQDGGVDIINIELPWRSGGSPGPGHVALGARLARLALAWGPDIVHVFKPKGPSGLAGALIWGWPQRSALVVDSDDWEGPGGWNDDPRTRYSPAARRVFAWQERFGLTHADAWTVTSECLRSRAIGFGADAGRVFHLPNGAPESGPSSPIRRSPEPDTVLLYTRFAGVAVSDVAAMWAELRRLRPEARLIVIGRGLAGEEEQLAGLPGVTSVGWVSPDELPGWFARCAVAALPWADKPTNRARHSAKLLELMAAEAPIVATSVGEIPATLGKAGVLVAPGDAAAFASAVAALLRSPERGRDLGRAARLRVAAGFTWEQLAERVLEAYDAALAHRRARAGPFARNREDRGVSR